ncbi:MAG: hypothetical protein AAFY71_25615 [Bacteroidota bacterium]
MSSNIQLLHVESRSNQPAMLRLSRSPFFKMGSRYMLLCFFLLVSFPAYCQTNIDSDREKEFLKLFDKEVQNRAFAIRSMSGIAEKAEKEGDKIFYDSWVEFETFLQKKYKPFADKHGLSQEARGTAKAQAFFGELASDILPKRKFYKSMLNQTKAYLEKLKKLPGYADEEDVEFAHFVVAQEAVQIKAIEFRIKGKNQEAADLFADFINNNK